MSRQRIALTQPYLPAYRPALFQRIVEHLSAEAVDLRLFHLNPGPELRERGEAVEASWSEVVSGTRYRTPVGVITHRKLPRGWSRPDLLVTELEAGNLNAWEAGARRQPYILLGHGVSGTAGKNRYGQRLENRLVRRAQHTMTYLPSGAAGVVKAAGVLPDKVSAFYNSTDSVGLRARRDKIRPGEVARFAREHGLQADRPTLLFVGRMDPVKRLDLVVTAIAESRRRMPDLQIILGGRGPSEDAVRLLADEPGVAWLGKMGPEEFALASHLSHVLLNPGRIGLVAVDALALNLFVVTATGASHAPEIEYLRSGVDLREVAATPGALAQAVVAAVAAGRPPLRSFGDYPTVERAGDAIATCLLRELRRLTKHGGASLNRASPSRPGHRSESGSPR